MKPAVINNNSETPTQTHHEPNMNTNNQPNNGTPNNDHSRRFPQFRVSVTLMVFVCLEVLQTFHSFVFSFSLCFFLFFYSLWCELRKTSLSQYSTLRQMKISCISKQFLLLWTSNVRVCTIETSRMQSDSLIHFYRLKCKKQKETNRKTEWFESSNWLRVVGTSTKPTVHTITSSNWHSNNFWIITFKIRYECKKG